MWQLNLDSTVQVDELMGSKIYTIDNVFKEPKKLERFLFNRNNFPVQGDPWTSNMIDFIKQRYTDWIDASCPLVAVAQHLCKQSLGNHGGFKTNIEAWLNSDFNNFEDNYWFPHLDNGYTCIVYFNVFGNNEAGDVITGGTNLYHPKLKEEKWFQDMMEEVPLGKNPWIPKKDVELVHTLEPVYNRMVLFDGNKFPHGSAVTNRTFFYNLNERPTNFRRNLCFFFYPETNDTKDKETT